MILRDSVTSAEIILPDDLLWTDELDWSPLTTNVTTSLAGSLIIEQATRLGGRPFTFVSPPEMAWVSRAVVQQLLAASAIPARVFKLKFEYTADTREFDVIFDTTGSPLRAEPVKEFVSPEQDDPFVIKYLKFIQVVV